MVFSDVEVAEHILLKQIRYANRVGIRNGVVIEAVYSPEPSVGGWWVCDSAASNVFAGKRKNGDLNY